MSTQPTEVIKEFLANTATEKVEAAARRLVAEDATYISLNFDNPELKQILPWTGTSKGPQAFIDTFSRVEKWWTIEDFAVTALFSEGENVAVFGRFTYRSVSLSKAVTSPFSIHAKVRNGKIVYFQFMEDTFATARTFSQKGTWTIKIAPNQPEFEV
ncbi:nuclear transport factor 2 family protein [Nostocaceae cyanobacterium CENA357]|uniref:Nuclear transport factor 2 family protein n=1 Tax=Atlanticothrix silvestris CENA357 TaxID=1725252 RepID=A0A8J7HHD2_9CYAN|nr:nuclear transport factor 2 family protein [Atlanticothrix silvestris]MBH8552576.1 nuclear transport factor 2 family protein [Atlanticothrix silvestris CENA357]